jgi:hypothetical protein
MVHRWGGPKVAGPSELGHKRAGGLAPPVRAPNSRFSTFSPGFANPGGQFSCKPDRVHPVAYPQVYLPARRPVTDYKKTSVPRRMPKTRALPDLQVIWETHASRPHHLQNRDPVGYRVAANGGRMARTVAIVAANSGIFHRETGSHIPVTRAGVPIGLQYVTECRLRHTQQLGLRPPARNRRHSDPPLTDRASRRVLNKHTNCVNWPMGHCP